LRPIEENCHWLRLQEFSTRAYLRHLFKRE